MDLLPTTIAGVRSQLRSIIYKAALQGSVAGAFGFLLGTQDEWTRPTFEIPLVVATVGSEASFWELASPLDAHWAAAQAVAVESQTTPLGLFVAWERFQLGSARQELCGRVVDRAVAMEIPYVVQFPTDGHETIWGPLIHSAKRYPHDALGWKMLRRKSDRAEDNLRRILRRWRTISAKVASKSTERGL